MKKKIILKSDTKSASKPRIGMAALEVVMIIGATLPVVLLLLVAVREALSFIHSIIGNLVGSPLF